MKLQGKKIAILIENGYEEPEIWYYRLRFAEEGAEVRFLSRLWGQPSLDFTGSQFQERFPCDSSFEGMDDQTFRSYAAVIVPGGIVSDRLRYTEDVEAIAPAAVFLQRAFADERMLKGIICHGLWLAAPVPQVVRGRRVVVNNNLIGDAKNMGAVYVNEDVVVDHDLVTARSSAHCHLFARMIIDMLEHRQ